MDELSKLPPTAWVLIAAAAALGFGAVLGVALVPAVPRAQGAARRGAPPAPEHLVDMLVPDGMGGGSTSTSCC